MLAKLKYALMIILVGALFALTRSDLSNVRVLATDSSFFTTQIAEVTRLEKEFLQFRVTVDRFAHGYQGVSKADVLLSFEILWARVNSEWTRFKNPRIAVLRDYGPDLGRLSAALKEIDALVAGFKPGDEVTLARIEKAMAPSVAAMSDMNAYAYGELYQRAVSLAESQRAALTSLNHFQLVYFVAVVAALVLLAINLRRSALLNRQLMAREAEIRQIAVIDPLTGLHNRRYFDDRMRALDKDHLPEAAHLLIIDLDGFKSINDSHGHIVGDLMLREIAVRIKQVAGAAAILTRIGGDEFGIIHSGSREHALAIAEAIVAAIRLPVVLPDHILSVGASIGIATLRDGSNAATILFDEADRALYEAKAKGRNCAVTFAPETVERSAA